MEAASNRNIKSGSEYNGLFKPAEYNDVVIKSTANLDDTMDFIPPFVHDTKEDTVLIAKKLKADSLEETLSNVWNFVYDHIRYAKDEAGIEQVRRPKRLWADRRTGGDCDCYSVFISSILINLNIPHALRITKYRKPNFQHIYIVVPKDGNAKSLERRKDYIVVDCVTDKYDYEVPFSEKRDYTMQLQALNGLEEDNQIEGWGDFNFNSIRKPSNKRPLTRVTSSSSSRGRRVSSRAASSGRRVSSRAASSGRRVSSASSSRERAIVSTKPMHLDCSCKVLSGIEDGGLVEFVENVDSQNLSGGADADILLAGIGSSISEEKDIDVIDSFLDENGDTIFVDSDGEVYMADTVESIDGFAGVDGLSGWGWGSIKKGWNKTWDKVGLKKAANKASKWAKEKAAKVAAAAKKAAKWAKDKAAKAAKAARDAAAKASKWAKDKAIAAAKAAQRYNPLSLLLRNGFVLAMKINLMYVAQKLRAGYASPSDANKAFGLSSRNHRTIKTALSKALKIFTVAGGRASELKKAILGGKGNKDKALDRNGRASHSSVVRSEARKPTRRGVNRRVSRRGGLFSRIARRGFRGFDGLGETETIEVINELEDQQNDILNTDWEDLEAEIREDAEINGLGAVGVVATIAAATAAIGSIASMIGKILVDAKKAKEAVNSVIGGDTQPEGDNRGGTQPKPSGGETRPKPSINPNEVTGGGNNAAPNIKYAVNEAIIRANAVPGVYAPQPPIPTGIPQADTQAMKIYADDLKTATDTAEKENKGMMAWVKANPIPSAAIGVGVATGIGFGVKALMNANKSKKD